MTTFQINVGFFCLSNSAEYGNKLHDFKIEKKIAHDLILAMFSYMYVDNFNIYGVDIKRFYT